MADKLDTVIELLHTLLARVPAPVVTKDDIAKAAANPAQGAMPPEQRAFIDAIMGMHRMPDDERTRARDENLRRYDEDYQNTYHPGNVPVGDLDVYDKAYLANMAGPYFDRTRSDLRWSGLVGGFTQQINSAFRDGEAWRNNYPASGYTGKLRPILAAMMGDA